jgi:hypothetical protein
MQQNCTTIADFRLLHKEGITKTGDAAILQKTPNLASNYFNFANYKNSPL